MAIHTVGDSNSYKGWTNVITHYLGDKLCYSFGREKLNFCDIRNLYMSDGDTVIFSFGEIDCRRHVHKCLSETNKHEHIINNIVDEYLDAIKINIDISQLKFKNVCIFNIIPPIQKSNKPVTIELPFLGTDEERKTYVLYFNKKLKEKCIEYNYVFFDIYDKYTDENGFLRKDLSDGYCHISDGIHITNFIKDNNLDNDKVNDNPFLLDFCFDVNRSEYTFEEYMEIQKKLKAKKEQITKLAKDIYPTDNTAFNKTFGDFYYRISKGITQKIIDIENNKLPISELFKIGEGGDKCIVCCTQFDVSRYFYSLEIKESLEAVNFNGYLYLLSGKFPNPTGEEIKYIGVPYSFKIFAMVEAKKLINCNKIVWIDACCVAINNLDKIFDDVDKYDIVCRTNIPNEYENNIPPITVDTIDRLTDNNFVKTRPPYIISIVLGLNFNSILVNHFVGDYYKMARDGWSFFSIFPEENVFSAILSFPKYKQYMENFHKYDFSYVFTRDISVDEAKNQSFSFFQRKYL